MRVSPAALSTDWLRARGPQTEPRPTIVSVNDFGAQELLADFLAAWVFPKGRELATLA